MAAQRPNTVVFQEFATLSTVAETPELEALIVGPAYHLMDFPDDRADILIASNYGALGADAPDTTTLAPVVVTTLPNNLPGAVLDSVRVFFSKARVEVVKTGDSALPTGTAAVSSPNLSVVGDLVAAGVQAGDYAILTDTGNKTLTRRVRSVSVSLGTSTVIFTSNLDSLAGDEAGFNPAVALNYRFERVLTDQEIDSSFISWTAAPLNVTIADTVTLPLVAGGTPKKVHFADEIYLMYSALRQDLAVVGTCEGASQITTKIGKLDARNPLAVGVSLALLNSGGTPIKFYGVTEQSTNGYALAQEAVSARGDIYNIVPLITGTTVLTALDTESKALSDADAVLAAGITQKFRVGIGLPAELPTEITLVADDATGDTALFAGSATASNNTLDFSGAGTPPNFLSTGVDPIGALPGDEVVIVSAGARNGTYVIQHVESATKIRVLTKTTGAALPAGTEALTSVTIKNGSGAARTNGTLGPFLISTVLNVADPDLYLDLIDTGATFLDDGIIPGDIIQMPLDPSGSVYTGADTFVIDSVVSNQRLRIVNNGRNTATTMTELPYGVTRTTAAAVAANNTLHYKVTRTLDKTNQITQLKSLPTALASRRTIFVWPDVFDVDGLKDGGLPRAVSTTLTDAASQPGYYLACIVAGLTSSVPSHQGLTNMAVAGVKKLYHVTDYFSETQISELSNSGYFVFTQASEIAPAVILHQLTTDVSTTEFGEYSMVKNFDYVSMYYAGVLDDYIGKWNINDETINFIGAGLNAATDQLLLDRRPRIGARINGADLTSIGQSTVSSDRLEIYLEADFPAPLNTVALHLVSK